MIQCSSDMVRCSFDVVIRLDSLDGQGKLFLDAHGNSAVQEAGGKAEEARRIGCDPKLFQSEEDRTLLYNILLHLADVSNPTKPVDIAAKWCETEPP